MGRIKTTQIKRITFELIKKHKDIFAEDFEENKKILSELLKNDSKKIRNSIAGYITRLMKNKKMALKF